jgi:5-formyltetrahydrofolate cyclo-ligase
LATLSPGSPVFALVFDEDIYEHVPREAHDIPVTGVVTPTGWRRFSSV